MGVVIGISFLGIAMVLCVVAAVSAMYRRTHLSHLDSKTQSAVLRGDIALPQAHGPPQKGDISLQQAPIPTLPFNTIVRGAPMNALFCPKCMSVRVAQGQQATIGGVKDSGLYLATLGPLRISLTQATELACMECGNEWKEDLHK